MASTYVESMKAISNNSTTGCRFALNCHGVFDESKHGRFAESELEDFDETEQADFVGSNIECDLQMKLDKRRFEAITSKTKLNNHPTSLSQSSTL
jgi:hypothetical protein